MNIIEELLDEYSDNAPQIVLPDDVFDRQPCWYANFDRGNNEWTVGVSGQDEKVELTFVGPSESSKSPNFAITILDMFQKSGKECVMEYINAQ